MVSITSSGTAEFSAISDDTWRYKTKKQEESLIARLKSANISRLASNKIQRRK
jgi:hypothetical protein